MGKMLFTVLVFLLSACSLDYSDSDLVQDLSEEVPNTVIYRYKTIEVQNGNPVIQILAEKAEVYDNREKTYLTDVIFYNYKDEKIDNQGKSDIAVLDMKSGDAQLSGSIEIESLEDETSLRAETLTWIDSDKYISSEPDDYVTVKNEDGSSLRGQGFSADIKRKTILFDGKTEGEYITDDN